MNGYISEDVVKRLLNSTNNPLKGRLNQIAGGDFDWFSDEFELAFPDVVNSKFSEIAKRMKEVSKHCSDIGLMDGTDEENILDLLKSDITSCAKDVGFFGRNIQESESNKAMLENANSRLVYEFVIDEMTKSFEKGLDDLQEEDLLSWSFSSNMGHNPEGFHPWKTDAASKLDFIDKFFDNYKMEHTRNGDRKIVVGYRKTLDKPDKLRPNFLLNRETGKLFESKYVADNHPFRVRSIASIPWYDNTWLMFVNQVLMIGKSDFLKKHIGFNTNDVAGRINEIVSRGKEPFASDVASADYTQKKEDIAFFFDRFIGGKLKGVHEGLFENMDIMGAYFDKNSRPRYYIQENYSRFLSGTGLTYWLNVAKYLSNQILNLVSYERVKKGNVPVWNNGASKITVREILAVDCLNKGDDALDFIQKGDSDMYEGLIADNPFLTVEKEPFCSFDGKRIVLVDGEYVLRSKYKTIFINSIEKRELRRPDNPLVPTFYSSLLGKFDLLNLYPTIDKELGLELLRLNYYMITGNPKLSYDDVVRRAAIEARFLKSSERTRYIEEAVKLLGLANINELNYLVNARTLGTLPDYILEHLFITKKMLEVKKYFYDL